MDCAKTTFYELISPLQADCIEYNDPEIPSVRLPPNLPCASKYFGENFQPILQVLNEDISVPFSFPNHADCFK